MPDSTEQKLDWKTLKASHIYREEIRIEKRDPNQLLQGFWDDRMISSHKPDEKSETDPRDGSKILYAANRAKRPHDKSPGKPSRGEREKSRSQECPICNGKSTELLELVPLTEGFTFINRNLFPVLFPFSDETSPRGGHFIQWSSNIHHLDWHNMPLEDRYVLTCRLAALEKRLLDLDQGDVLIIKNRGRAVGGSLEHGHQQIGLSSVEPLSRILDDRFIDRYGSSFGAWMAQHNPQELTVKEYKTGILVVPYFMKRPYNLLYIPFRQKSSHLHQLEERERYDLSEAIGDALKAFHTIMPRLGKEISYNVLWHTGSREGQYVEFLPHTQETGGFEQLGLWICQADPKESTEDLKRSI